ncbi:MAG: pyroglutamyl-peptidase I [Candidatus Nanopelagicaceae bacterium]|nr:pyroglutamyl-peptidase I [Candidatus Nanopelagicaceae bacterium]
MSNTRVLISGFEPFGGATLNPSQLLVEKLAEEKLPGVDLSTVILPVEFDRAAEILISKIKNLSPKVVISFGQAEGRSAFTPEKIAINLDDARIADNSGDARKQKRILEDGADGYFSTLPVEKIVSEINEQGVPSSLSLSAGSFVCNHIFYRMQHALLGQDIKSGFIHLPLVSEQSEEFPNQPTMSLDQMLVGAKTAILSTL